ncbi:MAG TPA: hypothetical protein VFC96_03780 [Anaerovoracaceae bacterium]|nr:hypothetical protein [Anaerovoracaceae bacterium]
MSKVSMVLNYWIYIIIVLLVAKLFKLSDNNKLMFILIGISTVFYVLFMIYTNKKMDGGKKK